MSRVAKMPIIIPINVDVIVSNYTIIVKADSGELVRTIHNAVKITHTNNKLIFQPRKSNVDGWIQAGTMRSLVHSMIIGVTEGFVKKLQLIGVGYRASIDGNLISLSLGFSHPIDYALIPIVIAECPSQTEIILRSIDKQAIGQVIADLRAYRSPDPYKGKGIRYADEIIRTKETKRK